ncbi:MAG: hypothetical protein HZA34_01000 [Candidatus Pacebacteria bacterium]|nr:hypothetical protein [Candidatus Paceibacterota bacterium]
MKYLFFLGRQRELSLEELKVVLSRFQDETSITVVSDEVPDVVSAELQDSTQPQALMDTLGGVVKIAQYIETLPSAKTETLEELASAWIAEEKTNKARKTFCIAEHGRNHLDAVSPQTMKKELIKRGVSARFIEVARTGAEAGLLLEGDVSEYHFIHTKTQTILAKTVAVQHVHHWSKRDMEKPYRDKKKGMIPPKLARTLINLAAGSQDPKDLYLFDPFCGTGTIMMEALLMHMKVAGSDLDTDAVHGAGENLAWLSKEFNAQGEYMLSVQDATQVTLKETKEKVDCIVTEPFLGKPNPTPTSVQNMLRGLEKLYIGAFKQWKTILKPKGCVVIAFPEVTVGKSVKTVQTLIDRLESLGYTREKGPFLYTKLHASVQRALYVYRLKE